MFERFIDEYEGVQIKLPMGFIRMNKLEPLLKKFKKDLQKKAKLSLRMPDYENSIYELENYPEKEAHFQQERDRDRERVKVREDLLHQQYSKERIKLIWVERKLEVYDDCSPDLILGDRVYTSEECCTLRSGLKLPVKRAVQAYIAGLTKKTALKFITDNWGCMWHGLSDMEYKLHWRFCDNSVYLDKFSTLSCRVEILAVNYFTSLDRYFTFHIEYNSKAKGLIFRTGLKDHPDIHLKDYKFNDSHTWLHKR